MQYIKVFNFTDPIYFELSSTQTDRQSARHTQTDRQI